MEAKTKLLIAVGASVTAGCQPCLNTAVAEAEAAGVGKKDILEAIASTASTLKRDWLNYEPAFTSEARRM